MHGKQLQGFKQALGGLTDHTKSYVSTSVICHLLTVVLSIVVKIIKLENLFFWYDRAMGRRSWGDHRKGVSVNIKLLPCPKRDEHETTLRWRPPLCSGDQWAHAEPHERTNGLPRPGLACAFQNRTAGLAILRSAL